MLAAEQGHSRILTKQLQDRETVTAELATALANLEQEVAGLRSAAQDMNANAARSDAQKQALQVPFYSHQP